MRIAGSLNKYGFAQADNVWSVKGVCPTVLAHIGGQIGHQIQILKEYEDKTDMELRERASGEGCLFDRGTRPDDNHGEPRPRDRDNGGT